MRVADDVQSCRWSTAKCITHEVPVFFGMRKVIYAGGWFARNAQVLRKVGEVLLDSSSKQGAPLTRWLTAADAFDHSDKATSQAIYKARA